MKKRCLNKVAYAYKDDALKFAAQVYKTRRIAMSVYECPSCLDFHLTSKYVNLESKINLGLVKTKKANRNTQKTRAYRLRKKYREQWLLSPLIAIHRLYWSNRFARVALGIIKAWE